jgi:hypothetical protein
LIWTKIFSDYYFYTAELNTVAPIRLRISHSGYECTWHPNSAVNKYEQILIKVTFGQNLLLKYSGVRRISETYYTHRGSCFEWCVRLSYLIQKTNFLSSLKTASPISIVRKNLRKSSQFFLHFLPYKRLIPDESGEVVSVGVCKEFCKGYTNCNTDEHQKPDLPLDGIWSACQVCDASFDQLNNTIGTGDSRCLDGDDALVQICPGALDRCMVNMEIDWFPKGRYTIFIDNFFVDNFFRRLFNEV